MDRRAAARTYYRAIDGDEYDTLAGLLAPSFRHERPDRTIAGRDRFVRFMREERPATDTTHAIGAVYAAGGGEMGSGTASAGDGAGSDPNGGDDATDATSAAGGDVAVEGRLLDAGGEPMFAFVDVFAFEETAVAELRTYANGRLTE